MWFYDSKKQSSLILSRVLGGWDDEGPAKLSTGDGPDGGQRPATASLHLSTQFHNAQLPLLYLSLAFNALWND